MQIDVEMDNLSPEMVENNWEFWHSIKHSVKCFFGYHEWDDDSFKDYRNPRTGALLIAYSCKHCAYRQTTYIP